MVVRPGWPVRDTGTVVQTRAITRTSACGWRCSNQAPLVYFHGIVPGLYAAEWPVFIVGDEPGRLTFTVSVDERRFAQLGTAPIEEESPEIRRRYATRLFRQRLHQTEFRERVVRAYQHHCAVCRLKRDELLEAAHIVPDADALGAPTIPNGVALCMLHHAAFDRYLIGINPDCVVEDSAKTSSTIPMARCSFTDSAVSWLPVAAAQGYCSEAGPRIAPASLRALQAGRVARPALTGVTSEPRRDQRNRHLRPGLACASRPLVDDPVRVDPPVYERTDRAAQHRVG